MADHSANGANKLVDAVSSHHYHHLPIFVIIYHCLPSNDLFYLYKVLNAVRNVKICGVLKQRDGSPYISLVIVSNDVAPTKKLMDNYLERHARLKELIITEDPTLKAILTNVQFIASTRGEYNRDIEMHDHQYDNCNHYKQYYSFFGTPYREASKTSSSTTKSKKSTKKTKANKKAASNEVFSEEDEEDECSSDMESELYGYKNNDESFEYYTRDNSKPEGFYVYDDDDSFDGEESKDDDDFDEEEPGDSVDDYFDDIWKEMKKNLNI